MEIAVGVNDMEATRAGPRGGTYRDDVPRPINNVQVSVFIVAAMSPVRSPPSLHSPSPSHKPHPCNVQAKRTTRNDGLVASDPP